MQLRNLKFKVEQDKFYTYNLSTWQGEDQANLSYEINQ